MLGHVQKNVLDQKIQIRLMHDLLHKSNKRQHACSINSLWIFPINRFTIQKTNQIHVSLGKTTTDLEVNLTERKEKDVSLAPAIDEYAWKYPGPKCSRCLYNHYEI